MAEFVDFINYLGLFENDGTPKQAWLVFQEKTHQVSNLQSSGTINVCGPSPRIQDYSVG
jgi:hypothetical protein